MVLGFKQQFVPKILAGTKIHTIREDKHDRWKAGNKIHFSTGVRTSYYNKFKEGECISVQHILIKWLKGIKSPEGNNISYPGIWVDGRYITDPYKFASNDGFESWDEFCKWFNKDFEGKIIHWTDFKY